MISARCYCTSFAASAQTNKVDWFELQTGSTGYIALVGLDIGQTTELGDAQEEQIDYYIKRGTGSVTSGSGGNTSVARKATQPGEAAATFTVETLNTTQLAVGTGTLDTILNSAFNLRAGLQQFWTPETAFCIAPSSYLAIGMTGNPADSVTWVGTAYVMEYSP